MYFLTIKEGNSVIVERAAYSDFGAAIEACGAYYEPKASGASLQFTTVVTRKRFMRAYAQLTRPEDLPQFEENSPVHWKAAKDSNAFDFSCSYAFLIESEAGIGDLAQWEDA